VAVAAPAVDYSPRLRRQTRRTNNRRAVSTTAAKRWFVPRRFSSKQRKGLISALTVGDAGPGLAWLVAQLVLGM
jgi:hypothetical protein